MLDKTRLVVGGIVLAAIVGITFYIVSVSSVASAEEPEGQQSSDEEAAQVVNDGPELDSPRFTVEGAPEGVKRHQEIITDNETGRQYMIVFEGSESAAFEINPQPVPEKAAGQEEPGQEDQLQAGNDETPPAGDEAEAAVAVDVEPAVSDDDVSDGYGAW